MNKKDFFHEKTSPELDRLTAQKVSSILELKEKNYVTLKKKRNFLIWGSFGAVTAATYFWVRTQKQTPSSPDFHLLMVEELSDEILTLSDLDLDILEDLNAIENLDIIEEWSPADETI